MNISHPTTMLSELKKNPAKYIDAVNDVLRRIQEGLRTQDLDQSEIELLQDRFGYNWFSELGYDKLSYHKEPIFSIPQ